MRRRLCIFPVLFFSLSASTGWASPESARNLRNAKHFYQIGEYEKAKGYFLAVLAKGADKEKSVARHFLSLSSLRNVRAQKPPRLPPPPVKPARQTPGREEELPPEEEPAPERVSSESGNPENRLQLSGYVRNETAFRISDPGQLSKMRTVALIAGTGQINDDLSYKISGRFFYDAVFDLTRHYPKAVADDERTDASLRDTYLDYSHGDWDVRAGRQQIVWGEAVGLFYADVVNAKDLREFVLPDFDFIRIPQWGTDIEYTHSDFHAEMVWLPILEFNKFGLPGSEFFPALPVPAYLNINMQPEKKPGDSLPNSEIGGRLSYRTNGWDASFFHLRTWDTFPVFARTQTLTTVTLYPFHPRLTIDGFTVAKEINDVVYKTEFIYNHDKYFLSTDPLAPNGLEQKDYIDYLLGADYTFSNNLSSALQFSQRVIPNYTPTLFGEQHYRSYLTLLLRRPFRENRIIPEVSIIKDLATHDVMARPKITFKIGSSWRFTTGFDLFGGSSDELFGEFADRNRVYGELRYDF